MYFNWPPLNKFLANYPTRKTGGLILTVKGTAIFTAEPQRTLREMFFSFPLRGRKAKIVSPAGHDGILYPVTDTFP